MPKAKHRAALHATAQVGVNSVVWLESPKDSHDSELTQHVLTLLQPLLQALRIPFIRFQPQTAAELFDFLKALEAKAKNDGLRPIIHLDTHGSPKKGLYIAASKQFVTWQNLVDRMRPVNVAAQNNICVVSTACFSLDTILAITIHEPTPFFLMFASQRAVTFPFIAKHLHWFYEDVFTSHDIMGAHERHLAAELQQYHCQRVLLKGLTGYIRDGCIGRGLRKRVRRLIDETLGPGKQHPNTPVTRRMVRRTVPAAVRPTQTLIDRYARPFLMGQSLPMGFQEIIDFVCAEAVMLNVRARRAARGKRRVRRVEHARRKRLRAMRQARQ